jgi:transcriptional regulator with XRE-family HTH domain
VRVLAEQGLSRHAIARRAGVPVSTVSRWMSGHIPRFHDPDAETCDTCGHPVHTGLDGAAYSYVLGLYLGDGHVATFPRTKCLRVYLDERYPEIIRACADSIARLVPHNRVAIHRQTGCAVVQSYSRQWACLLPQHGPGRKHERTIALTDWQRALTHDHPRELVRGLLQSDGCRAENAVMRRGRRYVYPRYGFSNRSEDIKAIFCEHLDLLGIAWRRAGAQTISIARREAVAALDAFVGPKR